MNILHVLIILKFSIINAQITKSSSTPTTKNAPSIPSLISTTGTTARSTISYIFAQTLPLVYYCPIPGSVYTNATGTPHCYQSLGAILRSEYNSSCSNIGSSTLNVLDSATAAEVILILQKFGFYGTWISAGLINGNYIWTDGRPLSSPYQWCTGATKTFSDVVLVCSTSTNDSYSMKSCCIADRNDNATVLCMNGCRVRASKTWIGICMMNAILDSCEFIQKRTLDSNKFTYIYSVTGISSLASADPTYNIRVDPLFNFYCCSLCQNIPNCTAYNNWRTNDTCNFYRNKVPIGDLMSAVIISRLNVFAGLRLSEEIQAMYSN